VYDWQHLATIGNISKNNLISIGAFADIIVMKATGLSEKIRNQNDTNNQNATSRQAYTASN
jgi:hypothetical protein